MGKPVHWMAPYFFPSRLPLQHIHENLIHCSLYLSRAPQLTFCGWVMSAGSWPGAQVHNCRLPSWMAHCIPGQHSAWWMFCYSSIKALMWWILQRQEAAESLWNLFLLPFLPSSIFFGSSRVSSTSKIFEPSRQVCVCAVVPWDTHEFHLPFNDKHH